MRTCTPYNTPSFMQLLPVDGTTFIKEWTIYGRMARIRIDDDAKEKLEQAAEQINGTKSGIASEAIREKANELLNDG